MNLAKLIGPFKELAGAYPTALANVVCSAQCGPGWMSLVIPVLDACERNGVAIEQIKQKFGGLRVYTSEVNAEADAAIDVAAAASFKTCEECGEPGARRVDHGWITTLCDRCNGAV